MAAKDDKPSKSEPVARSTASEKESASELAQIQSLYDLMVEEGLDSLELKDEESHIRLSRRLAMPVTTVAAVPHPPSRSTGSERPPAKAAEPAVADRPSITSPLAGVFYRSSSPTNPPFVKEGDAVEVGQTLCIVEAMKVMNEIKAESACRIARIAAENGRPVAAGQALFLVDPA